MKKSVLRAMTAAMLAVAALAFGSYAALERPAEEQGEAPENTKRPDAQSTLPVAERRLEHILLVGVDAADEDGAGRSDAMMVLSIDREAGRLVLASFMRDIYCAIPNYGASRLNHAYLWGGIELLCATLEDNFDITPQAYVTADFAGFAAVIDAVGGVDIDLTQAEAVYLSERMERTLPAGSVHMDGDAALEYARLRDVGNADYDRTARQRGLLMAAFERVKTLSLRELTALARALFPVMETNITAAQCLSLAAEVAEWQTYELIDLRIPVDGTVTDAVVDGMMVLDIDFEANRRAWRGAVYGEDE